jgi:hypothetical protein
MHETFLAVTNKLGSEAGCAHLSAAHGAIAPVVAAYGGGVQINEAGVESPDVDHRHEKDCTAHRTLSPYSSTAPEGTSTPQSCFRCHLGLLSGFR